MSGSGRRRSSKLDFNEKSQLQSENLHENAWPGKEDLSFHVKESKRAWISPEEVAGNNSKMSILEPLPGRRVLLRDDSFDEDHNRSLKAMLSWNGEESYGTRMSPGLDKWRQQDHRYSPKTESKRSRRSRSQSRSRSRSPVRSFGRESGLYHRSKSRSSVSAPLCKDFAVGRCRRGNHCPFHHQGPESYEDGWERPRKTVPSKYLSPYDSREYPAGRGRPADCCTDFLKGSCRRGESCRFPHHGASHVAVKGSSNNGIRERNDKRYKDASPKRHNHEFCRAADVPCKYFAAGNCRNGTYCRFSHQIKVHASPERSQDARCSLDQNFDDEQKLWNGPKWRFSCTSDAGKLSEDKHETIGAPDQRGSARSVDDGWSSWEDKTGSNPLPDHKMAENEAFPWETKSVSDSMLASELRAGKNWLGDMDMSPEWNYKVQPSSHIDKQEHASLTSCDHGITLDTSGQVHDATAVVPLLINEASTALHDYNLTEVGATAVPHDDKSVTGKTTSSHSSISANMKLAQSLNQNCPNANALPLPGLDTVGQGQVTIPSSGGIINTQNQKLLPEGKIIDKPEIGDVHQGNSGVPLTQNMVSSEQFNHLTNISASLAQLLANAQQLPQLYAVHNSQGSSNADISSFTNPGGPVNSTVTIQSNHNVGLQKQYDPICDNFELEKNDINNNLPGFSPNFVRQKNIADGKPEISKNLSPPTATDAPNDSDYSKFHNFQEANGKSYKLNQMEPGANTKATEENNVVVNEESRKEGEETVDEDCPLENIDGDGKTDEGKKIKDVKGVRTFKFALVELVKEILKPTWKEGQMSKDAYKNIVKKVVDKVTGTMQGASIPQTQEKIQQYLSFSKPKLTKLVQAYVEKFQKDK